MKSKVWNQTDPTFNIISTILPALGSQTSYFFSNMVSGAVLNYRLFPKINQDNNRSQWQGGLTPHWIQLGEEDFGWIHLGLEGRSRLQSLKRIYLGSSNLSPPWLYSTDKNQSPIRIFETFPNAEFKPGLGWYHLAQRTRESHLSGAAHARLPTSPQGDGTSTRVNTFHTLEM